MRCIVLWQFSLLGVLTIVVITGWRCFVCADALPITGITSDSHGFNSTHSSRATTLTSSFNDDTPSTSASTNKEDSLEEQLRDDQAALSRMIIILSLLGGLGGIAILATIIIVMKTQRRKKRKMEKDDIISAKDDEKVKSTRQQQTILDHHHQQSRRRPSSSSSSSSSGGSGSGSGSHSTGFIIDQPSASQHNNNECNNTPHDLLISTESSTNSDSNSGKGQNTHTEIASPQSSAPPNTYSFVPTMITNSQHRRVLSLPSQRQLAEEQPTPIPSAPSAKELDSVRILRESGSQESSYQGQDESFYFSRPSTIIDNSTHSVTPDLPPPAYTLNPSPFYDGSHHSANSNTSVAQLTTLRRHSQT